MDALAVYFSNTKAVTDKARRLKDDWIVWYDGLSWWEKNYDSNTWDVARNKRNAFNLANTVTTAQKEQVEQTIKQGFTTEETQGQPSRMTSEGTFPTQPEPLISTRYKVIGGAVLAVGLYAYFTTIRPALKAIKKARGK